MSQLKFALLALMICCLVCTAFSAPITSKLSNKQQQSHQSVHTQFVIPDDQNNKEDRSPKAAKVKAMDMKRTLGSQMKSKFETN